MPALKKQGASIIRRPKEQFTCMKLTYDEDGDLKREQCLVIRAMMCSCTPGPANAFSCGKNQISLEKGRGATYPLHQVRIQRSTTFDFGMLAPYRLSKRRKIRP